jgi:DNA polymerase-3 subunit beta
MIANVEELKGAIDRVSTVSDGQTNCVKLSISEGKIEVSSKSGNGSSASEDLVVSNQFGLEIGFNSKYLLDALAHVKSDECLIKFDQAVTPTIITGVEASDYVFVVMPLRV